MPFTTTTPKKLLTLSLLFSFIPTCQAPLDEDEEAPSPVAVSELSADVRDCEYQKNIKTFEARYPLLDAAIEKRYQVGIIPHLATEDEALNFINEHLVAIFSQHHTKGDEWYLTHLEKEFYALKTFIAKENPYCHFHIAYSFLSEDTQELALDLVEAYLILNTPPTQFAQLKQQIMTVEMLRDHCFNWSPWGLTK